MSSIKAVVKVMNFHSLLRVDKSRNSAKKYIQMQDELQEMIDNIMYNRNIMLDYKTLRVNKKLPALNIYIGSDMGFCSNVNSLVKKFMAEEPENDKQIIIGRKLLSAKRGIPVLFMTRQEMDEDNTKVTDIIEDAIRNLKYSSINIIYNKYINASKVEVTKEVIFPAEENKDHVIYNEDFVMEGEPDKLLVDMVTLLGKYKFYIAAETSSAAENINRQNVTTESLDKIEEREAEEKIRLRREEKEKQFSKVLDNFTQKRNR